MRYKIKRVYEYYIRGRAYSWVIMCKKWWWRKWKLYPYTGKFRIAKRFVWPTEEAALKHIERLKKPKK